MRIIYSSIFVLAMAVAITALAPQAVQAAEVDRIVAIVNGEIITMRQVDSRVNALMKTRGAAGVSKDQMQKRVLEALVEQELVNQAAKSKGVMITGADVNQAIEAIKSENKINDAQLRASLAQSGATMESFREDLYVELLRNRVMGTQIASKIVVTNKEVLNFLNGDGPTIESGVLGNFSLNDHLPVRLIAIPANPSNKRASLDEARRIKGEIESGLSFSDAAARYSKGPGADNGGDTGEGLTVGHLHPNLKAAVANIPPGTPSEPVDMGNAFVILMSVGEAPRKADSGGKTGTAKSLDEFSPEAVESARRQLERYKMQQRYTEWLNDLKSKAIIRINL